ncbi:hypothetical protein [Actinokineospora sp. NBRC 105648]|uniref:hypothetical protein n=1 Tax=Actinokineospora sp. NBRC 105648 TaxID=3032206 RepID=UPI0024A0D19C|nr:hypothetical protein [Actinokineospora sp. NBRC 105648]GLZ39854.1 hypothetical protein Acsp05_34780 [Actinokineospora sp. NBRC 105648]
MTALVVLLVVMSSWGSLFLLLRWLLGKPVEEVSLSLSVTPWPKVDVRLRRRISDSPPPSISVHSPDH